MRSAQVWWRLLVVALLCQNVVAKGGGNVIALNDRNFYSELANYEYSLVMFYAHWCWHSQSFLGKFAQAADELSGSNPPFGMCKVECMEDGRHICKKRHIDYYPVLHIFKRKEFLIEYFGPQDADAIVKYMRGLTPAKPQELSTHSEFDHFVKVNEVSIVGFFRKDALLKAVFFKLFHRLKEKHRFAFTTTKELSDREGVRDRIVLYRPYYLRSKFEDDKSVFVGRADSKEIRDFIQHNYHGLVGHRTQLNKNDFQRPLVITYYNLNFKTNPRSSTFWRTRVLEVASLHPKQFTFVVCNREEFLDELRKFGVDSGGTKAEAPTMIVLNAKNQYFVFPAQTKFTLEFVEKFIDDVIKERIKPMKVDPALEFDSAGYVKSADAENFDKTVVDHRDAFIHFHGDDCLPCVGVHKAMDEVAEKLRFENIDFVKMNIDSNEVPYPFQVEKTPTLYWVPAGFRNSPILYRGAPRTLDMIHYIAKHSTEQLKEIDRNGMRIKTEL